MIYDTDVVIWFERGNKLAGKLINADSDKFISLYTYMELFQAARDKSHHHQIASFLREQEFKVLELTGDIGHRAAVYVEEYALSGGLKAGDALIAATAVEHSMVLCSGNYKHFKVIKDLQLKVFTA